MKAEEVIKELSGNSVALSIARFAVERLIGKEAVYDDQTENYECPICGGRVYFAERYCKHCGQAISFD